MLQQDHIAQVLTTIPLFSDLDRDELNEIIRIARPVEFQVGQVVCDQDDPGDSMFVVAAGRAEVRIRNNQGQFVSVAKLGPGELIGELALIDAQPRSAQVKAVSKVEGLQLMRADFVLLQKKLHPATYKIMKRIVRTVCGRLRSTNISIMNAINPQTAQAEPRTPLPRPKTFWRGLLEKVRGGQG